MQLVGLAELSQYTVEAVEERYPVIQIAASKRPSRRKLGEVIWQRRQWEGCGGLDIVS